MATTEIKRLLIVALEGALAALNEAPEAPVNGTYPVTIPPSLGEQQIQHPEGTKQQSIESFLRQFPKPGQMRTGGSLKSPEPPPLEPPESPAKPRRRNIRVTDNERALVACTDGESRRWYAGMGMRRWAERSVKEGTLPHAWVVPASKGLGARIARHYYGDNDPIGVLLSDEERAVYYKAYPYRSGSSKKKKD